MKKGKPKLKMMNEPSAAEGVKRIHAAVVLYPTGQYRLIPERFPRDIPIKYFLEILTSYLRLWSEQRPEPPEVAATITENELEKADLSPRERGVFDVFRNNPGFSNQQLGELLSIGEETFRKHMTHIYEKLRAIGVIKGRRASRQDLWKQFPPNKP